MGLNILFLAGFDMGIEGYVLSVILADGLTTVFLFFVARLYKAFIPKKINGAQIKDMIKFCLPLVPSSIFWWITSVSDRYIVAAFRSDAENGLYAAAYKIPTLLTYVVTIFNDAWKLSTVSEGDSIEEKTKFYTKTFKYYIAVMFMGGALLAVTPRLTSTLLFADEYSAAWVFIPMNVMNASSRFGKRRQTTSSKRSKIVWTVTTPST